MARSLLDELRSRDDAGLIELLERRPDLASPLPANLEELARRAATRGSVVRALDAQDYAGLTVLEGALGLQQRSVSLDDLADAVGIGADVPADAPVRAALAAALDRLRLVLLVWPLTDAGPDHPETEQRFTVVGALREFASPYPVGLGPPAERLDVMLPDDLGKAIEGLSPAAGRLLTDAQRQSPLIAAGSLAAQELLDAGLVAPDRRNAGRYGDTNPFVVIPLEVGRALRGGLVVADPQLLAPTLAPSGVDPALADQIGAGAAAAFVGLVDRLLGAWSENPPEGLRSGGLPVRAVTAAKNLLGVDERVAVLTAEVAYAAGLAGPSADFGSVYLPSPEYDRWRTKPVAQQWRALATAWVDMLRVPGLAGVRDQRDKRIAPLSVEAGTYAVAEVRRALLATLAESDPGAAVTPERLAEVVTWTAPRRGGDRHHDLVEWAIDELPVLGLTGLGALTSYARALVAGEDAVAALDALVPAPVDHVLLQADLTAVAPGPLTPRLADRLAAVADLESTGGATVYRFSRASVQRAFDAGQAAEDVHELLRSASRTPVPQPLTYLVDEVARRHGRVRVSAATAIVRVDDPSTADVLVEHPKLTALQLRRLGPTYLASTHPVAQVVDAIREAGHPAVPEGVDGEVVVSKPETRRVSTYRTGRRTPASAPARPVLLAAVRALRVGERARAQRPDTEAIGQLSLLRPNDLLQLLRDLAAEGRTAWIGYVDNNGTTTERLVDPIRVHGGWLTAYDHRREAVRTFALHRIRGAAAVVPEDDTG